MSPMDIHKLSPITAFIAGALLICAVATLQYTFIVGYIKPSMYILPIIVGGAGALMVRYWMLRLVKSKEEILEQHNLLDIAMDSADMGFFDWNMKTDEVYFDQRWCQLIGYSIDEIKPCFTSWKERIHSDDIDRCYEDIRAHKEGETVNYHNIHRMKHRDGHWVHILAQGKIVKRDKNNKALQFTGTHQDITARMQADMALKKNEFLYRDLFERSAISIWMEDLSEIKFSLQQLRKDGVKDLRQYLNEHPEVTLDLTTKVKVVQVNEATLKLYHSESYDDFLSNITNTFGESAMETFVDELCAIWRGDTTFSAEVAFVALDGRHIDALLSFHIPVTEEDFANIPISIIDITRHKQMEEELFKSRKLESVGVLAGGIAHDFNNLLTGYFGNIALAKQKLSSKHEAFSHIETAGLALDKATNLTKQLLTFAKGGDPLLEIIGVKQIIEDAVKLSLSGSNIMTKIKLSNDLWQVFADKGQLSQVLTNLIINADQAMPDGGKLTIKAQNIKNADSSFYPHLSGNYVQFTIRDTGHGIASTDLEKIFDPYFTTKHEGSGLGLATVHSIVNKHKGNISVESEQGEGTTFTIFLPAIIQSQQVAEVSAKDVSANGDTEQVEPTPAHILVMDDNEMILDLSTSMLKLFGYSFDTAIDGEKTIEKYMTAKEAGKAFDIVIMDLTIPGSMGGKETVSKLLEFDPQAKVIVSSGYSTDPIMANFGEYGFRGILVKPFQMDDMKKELSRLVSEK